MLEAVVPIHHELCLAQLSEPGHHTFDDVDEGLLSHWFALWVAVHRLEMCKGQLCWRCTVGVWPSEQNGHLQCLHHLQTVLTVVVGCIVLDDHGVLLPVWPLPVQLGTQGAIVQLHHGCVRVGLAQGEVEVAQGVQCDEQGDPGQALLNRDGGGGMLILELPIASSEITSVDPALIKVHQYFALERTFEELE